MRKVMEWDPDDFLKQSFIKQAVHTTLLCRDDAHAHTYRPPAYIRGLSRQRAIEEGRSEEGASYMLREALNHLNVIGAAELAIVDTDAAGDQ